MKDVHGELPRLEGWSRADLEAVHLVPVVTDEDQWSSARDRLPLVGDESDRDGPVAS